MIHGKTAIGSALKKCAAAAFSVAAALAFPIAKAYAQEAPSAAETYGIAPWSEVVVSVTDLSKSSDWLVRDGGWRVVSVGAIDPGEIAYWGLPENVSGAFRKICAPKATTGCIRYVRFDGVKEQKPIRPAARPWDTGGIFSIMLRSDDTQKMYDAAIRRGWWAETGRKRLGNADRFSFLDVAGSIENGDVVELKPVPARILRQIRFLRQVDGTKGFYGDASIIELETACRNFWTYLETDQANR